MAGFVLRPSGRGEGSECLSSWFCLNAGLWQGTNHGAVDMAGYGEFYPQPAPKKEGPFGPLSQSCYLAKVRITKPRKPPRFPL